MENPPAIVPFLRTLLAAKKSLVLYPLGSEMATTRVQQVRRSLDDSSAQALVFPIRVGRDRFAWAGGDLVTTDPAIQALRLDLQTHGIAEFSIDPGVEDWEIREFLEFLSQSSEKILAVGDAPAYLRQRGVAHVRVAAPGGLGLPADSEQLSTSQGVEAADDTGVTALLGARPGRP